MPWSNSSIVVALSEDVEETTQQLQEQVGAMDRAKANRTDSHRSMQLEKQQTEKYFARKALILKKKDDAMKKIRDLGALPEEAFQKFQDAGIQQVQSFLLFLSIQQVLINAFQLITNLHKAHESLKKYSHVNKKAYEQYSNFTKQREQLDERKDELNASAKVNIPLVNGRRS